MEDLHWFVILLILSGIFAYYEMLFKIFSRVKIRSMLQGEIEEREKNLKETFDSRLLQISVQLALILVNIPVVIWFFIVAEDLIMKNTFLCRLTAFGSAFIVLAILNVLLPAALVRKKRSQFTALEIYFLKLVHYVFCLFSKPIWKIIIWARSLNSFQEDFDASKQEMETETIIDVGEEEGLIEENQKKLMNSIVEFSETVVREIMVPRTDMSCIEVSSNLDDFRRLIIDTGYSRFPVYEGKIDHVIGIVNAKNLFAYWEAEKQSASIKDFMRPPYFIPETKKVTDLLQEFQREKIHMAIVVDEYGGVEGLVTLEDILEEIVGEIQDEFDHETDTLKVIDNNTIIVDARINIEEIEDFFSVSFPEEDYETVGGFIFQQTGKVPVVGEQIRFKSLLFSVDKADDRRIISVKIHKVEKVDEVKRNE